MMTRRTFLETALGAGAVTILSPLALRGKDVSSVEDLIRAEIASGRVSCVACGACGASRRYALGDRRALLGAAAPVQTTSLFELASLSKVFTAHLAASLACAGALDLDAPFVRYLPEHVLAKEGSSVTIRDLASHTSGFTDAWLARAQVYSSETWPFADDAAFFRALFAMRPVCSPNAQCVYSCTNFLLLGAILERVAGADLDSLARRLVWGPLGMKTTTWRSIPGDPRAVRIWTKGWRPIGTKGDEIARQVTRPVGNAGVFSSLDEMLLYVDDLVHQRAFPKACYETLFKTVYEKGRVCRTFCFDRAVGTNPAGWSRQSVIHSGYTGTYLAVDPSAERGVVILANLHSSDRAARAENFEWRRRLAVALDEERKI